MDTYFHMILGVLISVAGFFLIIYVFMNTPDKTDNKFSKAANVQFKILGLGLFIGGLFYAL